MVKFLKIALLSEVFVTWDIYESEDDVLWQGALCNRRKTNLGCRNRVYENLKVNRFLNLPALPSFKK